MTPAPSRQPRTGRPRRVDPVRRVSVLVPLSVLRRYEALAESRGDTVHALLQRSVLRCAPAEKWAEKS